MATARTRTPHPARRPQRGPGRPRARGRGEEASAAIVGFAVGVAIYAIAFVVFMNAFQSPAGSASEGTTLTARADGGLDTLLNTVGQVSPSSSLNPKSWKDDPDNITRFGLAPDGQPGRLDLDKMRNLTRGALLKDASNKLLDYEEARIALGLGQYDFHLRSYPLINTLEDAGAKPIKGLDVAYLGDFSESQGGGPPAAKVVNRTWEVRDMPAQGFVFVNITIQNNGTTGAVFQASMSWAMDEATLTDTGNTPWLAPDSTGLNPLSMHNITLKLYKTTTWRWAGSDKNVSVTLSDKGASAGSFKVDLAGITMTQGASGGNSFVEASADKVYYKPNEKPKVVMGVYDGEGDEVDDIVVNATVRWASNGTIAKAWQGEIDGSKTWNLNDQLPVGNYTVWVNTTANWSFHNADWIQVIDDAGSFTPSGAAASWVESDASKFERSVVYDLVDGFVNTTYDAGAGDVYPDIKDVMNGDLATNLTADNYRKYDVLVVGSNVDHNSMTSAAAKHAVRDFVLNGGLLVVFGSDAQSVNWLQPLFHSSITTSGGGVAVPDSTHSLLHSPEELAYGSYVDNQKTWKYNSGADAHFTHVITRSGSSPPEDTLSVSKPGHFGNGTIVLTGWTPYALMSPQSFPEARKVLYNFILQSLGSLYVDFGPPIPSYSEVASSSRMATAPHPAVPGEEVLVRLVLYVFR